MKIAKIAILHQQTSADGMLIYSKVCTGLKTTKIVLGRGSAPDPAGGAHDALQTP